MSGQRVLWRLARGAAGFLGRVVFDLRVYGAENVPERGGVLVVANHQSILDPVMLSVQVDRPMSYMAKSELFAIARPVTWLLGELGAFPVKQGAGDVWALKECIRRLKDGEALNLFPEGQRTEDGEIGRIERGVGLIVRRAKVPVVPAVIVGAYEAWPIGDWMFRPWPVRVEFGHAMEFEGCGEEEIVGRIDRTLRGMYEDFRGRCGSREGAGGWRTM